MVAVLGRQTALKSRDGGEVGPVFLGRLTVKCGSGGSKNILLSSMM